MCFPRPCDSNTAFVQQENTNVDKYDSGDALRVEVEIVETPAPPPPPCIDKQLRDPSYYNPRVVAFTGVP